jgi:ribosome modulation factor
MRRSEDGAMARIAYDSRDAAAYEAARHLSDEGLAAWREAVADRSVDAAWLSLLVLRPSRAPDRVGATTLSGTSLPRR